MNKEQATTLVSILRGQTPESIRAEIDKIPPDMFQRFFQAVRRLSIDAAIEFATMSVVIATERSLNN